MRKDSPYHSSSFLIHTLKSCTQVLRRVNALIMVACS